jgi:protoheme IX farnesyltransferase
MYRDEYAKAGIVMLPVVDKEGKLTVRQVLIFTVLLFLVSLIPFFIGLANFIYFLGAFVLNLYFLRYAILMFKQRTVQAARKVLIASVIYLPLIFALMALSF